MKTTLSNSTKLVFWIALFSALTVSSCTVTLLPKYDAEIAEQISSTAKQVDKFYLEMLETTSIENDGRKFSFFIQKYIDIEVELNALLNKNRVRPLNENSTRICEITLQLWSKYKEEHKTDNKLSNGLIKLNRQTFNDLFYAMQVAERGKDLVKNPPQ